MMTEARSEHPRPPLVLHQEFLETAFERRFQGLLRQAWLNRSWHVIAAEELYRSQVPDLHLRRWSKTIFTWLSNPILDPDGSGRVTMDHLTRLVTSALRRAYQQGANDVDASILGEAAEMMVLRRDEVVQIDGVLPVREVG